MGNFKSKIQRRKKIKKGIRSKVLGTSIKPRLTVSRSNKEIYVQAIDDSTGYTLASANSLQKEIDKKGKTKTEIASLVGELVAKNALESKIDSVVFDRNGYLYHGRVKALAEGARKGGLKF